MDRRLRIDLTDKLTYWLKPTVGDVAQDFTRALNSGAIVGSKPDYVLGSRTCVAFTEVPLAISAKLLINAKAFGINYAPVGFTFDRRYLFELGARPVIYQSAAEANLLPDDQKYRHVTLDFERSIDFTWKREWRIPKGELTIDARHCHPVLPSYAWLEHAREAIGSHEFGQALLTKAIVLEAFV